MQLVIEYAIGDGYTFSATDTIPVEYESAEAFAVDFEAAVRQRMGIHVSNTQEIHMGGKVFYADAHSYYSDAEKCRVYDAPNIFTVDEWFAYHRT